MNKVEKSKPLFQLYAPGARKQNFPKADYRFLVRVATNIARAVQSVHSSGCMIGDINQSGFLISDSAIATLIDADSFQVISNDKRYLCKVGTLDYTPPELQGHSLHDKVRTKDHDNFGLAVMIFQLLFMGRHPFSGTYKKGEIDLGIAIKEHRFAYSQQRNVGMTPPPGAPRLDDFPEEIQDLFEEAFSPTLSRPSAEKWATELNGLERSLIRCKESKIHYHSHAADECAWCRIEKESGVQLFIDGYTLSATVKSFSINIKELDNLSLLNFDLRPLLYVGVNIAQSQSIPVKKKTFVEENASELRWSIIIISVIFFLYAKDLWLISVFLVVVGLLLLQPDKSKRTIGDISLEIAKLDDDIRRAFSDLYNKSGIVQLHQQKSFLEQLKAEIDTVPQQEASLLAQLKNNRIEIERNSFLEKFFIRNASIDKIPYSLLGTLASYGIETAADIKIKLPHIKVPGIGTERGASLRLWMQGIDRGFRFIEDPAFSIREKALVDKAINDRLGALANEFSAGIEQIKKQNPNISMQVQNLLAPIRINLNKRETLVAEMKSLGGNTQNVNLQIPPIPKITRHQKPIELLFRSGKPIFSSPASPPPPSFGIPNTGSPPPRSGGAPNCPHCGKFMIKRYAKRGSRRGRQFWGCSSYPTCRGTRNI